MKNLWSQNTPRNFWRCYPDPPQEAWSEAYQRTFDYLGLHQPVHDMDTAAFLTLGEGQFGSRHWKLGPLKRLYYALKPLLPRALRYYLRQKYSRFSGAGFSLGWPIEQHYVEFLWHVVQQLMRSLGQQSLSFQHFWPAGKPYALVLTHDIETRHGEAFVREVADLEESLGFRSSFNFVPETYAIDFPLLQELKERGFEVGVHGLKHDGTLFNSQVQFLEKARQINQDLRKFGAVGFRSPLTIRNPEWMQALEIEYDLSFFDTDPYEPMPGGVMSIWPFTIGHFVELPYTLPQDSTLYIALGEQTSQIWMKKLDFIEQHFGMALINTHPDYLENPRLWEIYVDFLTAVKEHGHYWLALPCEAARWWKMRCDLPLDQQIPESTLSQIFLDKNQITFSLPAQTV